MSAVTPDGTPILSADTRRPMQIMAQCARCGTARPFDEMGQRWVGDKGHFYCHPGTSNGESCYTASLPPRPSEHLTSH